MDNSELLYQAHDSHTAWMGPSETCCWQRFLAGLVEHLLPLPLRLLQASDSLSQYMKLMLRASLMLPLL